MTEIQTAVVHGIEGRIVTIQAQKNTGRHSEIELHLPNVPETCVKEARIRVLAALRTSRYEQQLGRTTAVRFLDPYGPPPWQRCPPQLAVTHCDLAIAVAIAAEHNPDIHVPPDTVFLGELSIAGRLDRPSRGILSMCLAAKAAGFKRAVVSTKDHDSAAISQDSAFEVVCAETLDDALSGQQLRPAVLRNHPPSTHQPTFADLKGLDDIVARLTVAALEGRHVKLIGPPGSGKTMLARRVASALPPLSDAQLLGVQRIYDAHGLSLPTCRPFRAPHHSASQVGMAGELALAHCGVLFLDELPEFRQRTLDDVLANFTAGNARVREGLLPAKPHMLLTAMNLCPCGWADTKNKCACTADQINRYRQRVHRFCGTLQMEIIDVPRFRLQP